MVGRQTYDAFVEESVALTSWAADGLCTSLSGLPWTADRWRVEPEQREAMEAACAACPVRVACAGYARAARVTGGFWAGRHRDAPEHGPVQLSGTALAWLARRAGDVA